MTLLETVLLGLMQGITEFIPVSSSGHLVILSRLLDLKISSNALTGTIVFLHLGTIISLLLYLRRDVYKALKSLQQSPKEVLSSKLFQIMVVATIPAAIFGAFFSIFIEQMLTNDIAFFFSCIALIVSGAAMIIVTRFYKGKNVTKLNDINFKQALSTGIGQIFGVLYGVSRSGATISAARLSGIDNKASLKFAFYISVPIIAGATLYSMLNDFSDIVEAVSIANMIVGIITSAIAGYFAIAFLFRFLRNNSLNIFGVYCILAGLGSLILSQI